MSFFSVSSFASCWVAQNVATGGYQKYCDDSPSDTGSSLTPADASLPYRYYFYHDTNGLVGEVNLCPNPEPAPPFTNIAAFDW